LKIFDCITYYNEDLLFDLRCNILDKFVDYFVIVEAKFTHTGRKKELNFKISNFKKFKKKIIYHIIDEQPQIDNSKNIFKQSDELYDLRKDSLIRVNQSYEETIKPIKNIIQPEDYYILSDSDEIPKISEDLFDCNEKKIILFKQKFFYYKFNLFYDLLPWYGSKACKFKNLKSPTWLRYVKSKKYNFLRFDTFFSEKKYNSVNIIEDGGWHFSNIKPLKQIIKKLNDSGHSDEYQSDKQNYNKIQNMIKKNEVYYDHFLDKKSPNKIREKGYKLKKISSKFLPSYIFSNKKKFAKFL